MKTLISVIMLVLLLAPCVRAQTFAYDPQEAIDAPSQFSKASFFSYTQYTYPSKKKIAGIIVAASGASLVPAGLILFMLGSIQTTGPPNLGLRNAGIAVTAVGAAAAITGIVMITNGRRAGKYGLQLVAPKYNEMGIAVNF